MNWWIANRVVDAFAGSWAGRVGVSSGTVTGVEMAEAIGSGVRARLVVAFPQATEADPRRQRPKKMEARRFKEQLALTEHQLEGSIAKSFHCKVGRGWGPLALPHRRGELGGGQLTGQVLITIQGVAVDSSHFVDNDLS